MRILIIPSWYPHPKQPLAGIFFMEQAKALAKYGKHEIFVLNWGQLEYQLSFKSPLSSIPKIIKCLTSHSQVDPLFSRYTEFRMPHLSWNAKFYKGNIGTIAKHFPSDLNPDIIYAQVTFPAGFLAMLLSKRFNVPYIISEHSGPFPFPQFTSNHGVSPLVSEPINLARSVTAVSKFLANQIYDSMQRQCVVIPNMVNTSFFIPSLNHKKTSQLRLFCLTTFVRSKGVSDLFEALCILDQRGIDFCLLWGGDGPLRKEMIMKCSRFGGRVKFPGWILRKDTLTAYQNCDIFVMPSHLESFSIVLIEALSCGKPIIATDCGGPRDIVKKNLGILLPPKNPITLANAIIEMSSNIEKYDSLALREECLSKYSEEVVSQRILQLIEESISC